MKTHTKTLLTALACSAGLTLSASGAVLVKYEFTGGSAAQTSGSATGSSVAYGSFTGASSNSLGISSFSNTLFVRTSATDVDGNTLAGAITNNAYAGFTLTNTTGQTVDLTILTFDIWFSDQTSNTTYEMYVMSDAAAFSAGNELGGVVYDTTSVSAPVEANPDTITTNLSSLGNLATADSIDFRIYFVDDTNSSNPIFRVDNITVSGSAIPEPGSLALLGLGGLLVASRRRRD